MVKLSPDARVTFWQMPAASSVIAPLTRNAQSFVELGSILSDQLLVTLQLPDPAVNVSVCEKLVGTIPPSRRPTSVDRKQNQRLREQTTLIEPPLRSNMRVLSNPTCRS